MFEKFIKVSINEFGINLPYFVSLPGQTWQCGLKYTRIKLQTLQDKNLHLLIENNIRGGIGSVIGDRYVKSDDIKRYVILMLIICMVGLCQNHCLMMKFNLIEMLN